MWIYIPSSCFWIIFLKEIYMDCSSSLRSDFRKELLPRGSCLDHSHIFCCKQNEERKKGNQSTVKRCCYVTLLNTRVVHLEKDWWLYDMCHYTMAWYSTSWSYCWCYFQISSFCWFYQSDTKQTSNGLSLLWVIKVVAVCASYWSNKIRIYLDVHLIVTLHLGQFY